MTGSEYGTKNESFPLRTCSVNVPKSTVSCRFQHTDN